MINLLKIELIKQFKKKSFFVLCMFVIVCALLTIIISNNQYRNILDEYKKLELLLDSSIIPLIFMSIIVAIISSGILSDEINKRSIKELLTKPYKRYKILTSKYLCIFVIVFILSFLIFVTSLSTTFIIIKPNDLDIVYILNYLKLFLINIIPLLFTGTLCIFISTITQNSKVISGFVILINLTSVILFQLLLKVNFTFVQYTFLPYLDFSIYKNIDLINSINITYGIDLSIIKGLIILSAYSIILYVSSVLIFNKKDII